MGGVSVFEFFHSRTCSWESTHSSFNSHYREGFVYSYIVSKLHHPYKICFQQYLENQLQMYKMLYPFLPLHLQIYRTRLMEIQDYTTRQLGTWQTSLQISELTTTVLKDYPQAIYIWCMSAFTKKSNLHLKFSSLSPLITEGGSIRAMQKGMCEKWLWSVSAKSLRSYKQTN